jgi:hypothetical protein
VADGTGQAETSLVDVTMRGVGVPPVHVPLQQAVSHCASVAPRTENAIESRAKVRVVEGVEKRVDG